MSRKRKDKKRVEDQQMKLLCLVMLLTEYVRVAMLRYVINRVC